MIVESSRAWTREPLVGGDGQKRRFAAEGLDRFDPLVAALFAAAGDDDAGAGLGEAIAQRAAEDAGAADDDGDLVVEAEESSWDVAGKSGIDEARIAEHRGKT